MELKELVTLAETAINDLFGDQDISNLLFEEIEKDESGNYLVTIGFDRRPTAAHSSVGSVMAMLGRGRAFKVVKIDGQGQVLSVKDRLLK